MTATNRRRGLGLVTGLAFSLTPLCITSVAIGQEEAPEWVKSLAIDPDSPSAKKYAQQQKVRVAAEKELRKIRATHFGQSRGVALRQEGILKLREFMDPALFPSMIKIFKREQMDVRLALLDHFLDHQSPEGDTSLAWLGVFDDDQELRAAATERLQKRIAKEGKAPETVTLVVYEGLRSGKKAAMSAAAKLAQNLSLIEAIPWLIAGQVQGQTTGAGTAGGESDGALAWIMVGTQTAFVSDLTPVVGPNAVAFDPQLSVVTEGTVLRVMDAVVVTYYLDLNNALIELTEKEWGQPTRQFGWDSPRWREWYRKEFLPFIAERKVAAAQPTFPATTEPADAKPVVPDKK